MKLGAAHQGERDQNLGRADRVEVPGYRLIERLDGCDSWSAEGPGGFRAVLRFIRPARGADPDVPHGLNLIRRARHPNLQAVFGSWRIGGSLVLATELPDRSLWDRYLEVVAAGGPGIPRDELIDLLAEAARGIDYLNGNAPSHPDRPCPPEKAGLGISHDDIRPRTILYVGGGIKIAELDPTRWAHPLADPGQVRNSDYAAPERLAGLPSRHSDQFSLAVTYCQLRTGRMPFAAVGGQLRRPFEISSPLPAAEWSAVARALDPDPDRRWPSCRDFIETVRANVKAGDRPPAALGPSRRARDEPGLPVARRFGRAGVLTLAAASGVAAVAGGAWVSGARETSGGVGRSVTFPALTAKSKAASSVTVSLASREPMRVRLQDPDGVALAPDAPPSRRDSLKPVLESAPESPKPSSEVTGRPPERSVRAPEPQAAPPALARKPVDPAPVPVRQAEVWEALGNLGAGVAVVPALSSLGGRASAPSLPAASSPGVQPRPAEVVRVAPSAIRLDAPTLLTVHAGGAATLPFTLVCERVEGRVEVRLKGLPRGLTAATASVDPQSRSASEGGAGSALKLDVAADAAIPEGETIARLVATAGSARAEATVRLSVQPSTAVAARRRGDDLLRRDQFDQAIAAYDEAIRLDPTDDRALHARGLAAYNRGDFDRALADLDAALKLKPDSPTVLNNRGLARLARGDSEAALIDFNAAARTDPNYAVVRYNRGRAYAQAGEIESAIADYDEAVRLDPSFAKAYKARGDALSKRGGPDRERAMTDYDTALRLSPRDPATYNNRGLLLFAKGEVHRAIADFDEAIRVSPEYAVVRYNRGRVYAFLGDRVEALASFDQAIRLDPKLALAAQARAELLAPRPTTPSRSDVGVAARRDDRTRPVAKPAAGPGSTRPTMDR